MVRGVVRLKPWLLTMRWGCTQTSSEKRRWVKRRGSAAGGHGTLSLETLTRHGAEMGAARRRGTAAADEQRPVEGADEAEATAPSVAVQKETWWTRWVWRRRRQRKSRGRVYVLGPVWRLTAVMLLGVVLSKLWDRQQNHSRNAARLVSHHPVTHLLPSHARSAHHHSDGRLTAA
jgi:hypothetical protein